MCPDDREKLSFSERDRIRREGGQGNGERRPRGEAAERRSEEATSAYLKEADNLFSDAQGGSDGEEAIKAVMDAHGTPGFTDACRAFRESVGVPATASLLSRFLDAEDVGLVAEAIRALAAGLDSGDLEISRGIKSQLRGLEQSPDDDVAYEAEELLAKL